MVREGGRTGRKIGGTGGTRRAAGVLYEQAVVVPTVDDFVDGDGCGGGHGGGFGRVGRVVRGGGGGRGGSLVVAFFGGLPA